MFAELAGDGVVQAAETVALEEGVGRVAHEEAVFAVHHAKSHAREAGR